MINANLGVMPQDGTVTYIYGSLPIFPHAVDDLKAFRMITSQLYVNGSARQADICRAFGVSRISVKRSVKIYRKKGIAGFFEQPRRRGPAVLTPEILENVQSMLDNEQSIPEVARELNLKACQRNTPRHVQISDLPPEDHFKQLAMKSKYFIDTIKMIAYCAETVMANILRRGHAPPG